MSNEDIQSPLHFNADEPLTLCRGWVDPIRESLIWVHFHRGLWRDVMTELEMEVNPASTAWRSHYLRLYVDSQVASVRRMAEGTNRDEISLARLLLMIKKNVTSFDLDRLGAIGSQPDQSELVQRRLEWIEITWGSESGHLAATRIGADYDRLLRDTAIVRTWATKAVAHIDRRGATAPTYGELDTSIDDVTEVFQRYGFLLTGNHYEMDVVVDPRWRVPLSKLYQNARRDL